jgi:eukaryotic-like serine/threonine-protein kinase
MKASVRMVCGGCLRSVEMSFATAESGANRCPYCGGIIDSHSSQIRSPSEDVDNSTMTTIPAVTDVGQTIDWVKTWERGSLGSLGRFQLRERLGDGGFGQVFRAYDPRLDRDVAVKVLKQPNPSERVMERFFREARAVARLDHANIVAVHDAGFDNGRCWVAYQLVGGRPLWWYRDHHRMDATTVARIIRALADALDHSHHMGVVHRDLKPGNVLIDDQGRPRLIDFGLARRFDFESDLTREGAIVGTPAYMSPEQALGHSRQVDERSDVYSLGVIFYELLYGHRPDEPSGVPVASQRGKTGGSTVDSALETTESVDSAIPVALKKICSRATALNPAARHPTARALADELEYWFEQQRIAGERVMPSVRRMMTVGAASFLIVSLMATSLFIWRARSGAVNVKTDYVSKASQLEPAVSAPTWPERAVRFIGNRDTLRYHLPTCPSALSIKVENRIALVSAAEAAREFKPCSHCHPDMPAHTPSRPPGSPVQGP